MTIELIETRDQLQVLEDSTELIELITQGEQGVGITEGSKGIITIPANLIDWTLNDNVVTSSKIVNGTIVNDDINDNAAIALTKLATGALPTAITVTSANISDLSIVNADINASAAIAGTKISPDFGSQNIVTTGQFQATGSGNSSGLSIANAHESFKQYFVNNGDNSDFYLSYIGSGGADIIFKSNGEVQLAHGGSNKIKTQSNGVAVTGSISLTGTVDGRNVANDGTKLDGIQSGATDDQTAAEIKTLLQSDKLTVNEIADDAVTNAKIADNSVANAQLQDGVINTAKLATNSVSNVKIQDGVVTSAKIADGTIVNADVNASAAIAGSKIDPSFTSDITITNSNPKITLVDSNNNDDFEIINDNGIFTIKDITDSKSRFRIDSDGDTTINSINGKGLFVKTNGNNASIRLRATGSTDSGGFRLNHHAVSSSLQFGKVDSNGALVSTLMGLSSSGNLDISDGLDVTGSIVVSGTVDGVDIATRDTLFGGLTSSSGVLTDGVTATTQSAGNNTTRVATTAFVSTAISNLINNAPSALDTLKELSDALGADANFSTTVTNNLATKMPLAGGQFTGNITFSGSQTVDGRDLSVDGAKLDGIEANAINASNTAITNKLPLAGGTLTGDLTISTTRPKIIFTETDNNPDYEVFVSGGKFFIQDDTNNVNRFVIDNSDGHIDIAGNLDVGAGLDVTGNISCTGTVDGRDLQTDGTKLDTIETNATADQTASEIVALVADQTIAPSTIDMEDNEKILLGTGDDLEIFHHSASFSFITNNTGILHLRSVDGIKFQDQDGSEMFINCIDNGAVELYYDNVKKFETTSSGATVTGSLGIGTTSPDQDLHVFANHANSVELRIENTEGYIRFRTNNNIASYGAQQHVFKNSGLSTEYMRVDTSGNLQIPADNAKLQIGAGQDLELSHDGSSSYITNSTGFLFVQSNDLALRSQGQENYVVAAANGAVELFFDNSKKFETTTKGANVTGQFNQQVDDSTTYPTSFGAKAYAPYDHELVIDNNTKGNEGSFAGIYFNAGADSDGSKVGTARISAVETGNYKADLVFGTRNTGFTEKLRIKASGNLQILNDNAKLQIGASQDLFLEHDGNNSVFRNTTGDLYIQDNSAGNIYIQPVNNEGSITAIANGRVELAFDGSKKLETYANGIKLGDNVLAAFGDDVDLLIHHTGSVGYIKNQTGNFYIQNDGVIIIGNQSASTTGLKFNDGGALELFHNNVKKLETTSAGATVTGTLTATSFSGDGSNLTGISSASADVVDDSSPELGGNLQSNGNDINFADDDKAMFGTGSDLQIWHSSTSNASIIRHYANVGGALNNLYIDSGQNINFRSHTNGGSHENSAIFVKNGAAELYYDNSKKLETTSYGTKVTDFLNVGKTDTPSKALELYQASNAALRIQNSSTGVGSSDGLLLEQSGLNTLLVNYEAGNIDFKTANTTRLLITSDGHVQIPNDTGKIKLGASQDLEIYHNGNHSKIVDTGTGNLYLESDVGNIYLRVSDNEQGVTILQDGAAELYYDNSKKFETTISGVSVTGDITGTGDLTLTSTDTGASASPIIELYRNSASPSDADYLGQIKFSGESDDNSKKVYAKITGKIDDASSGTEDGIIEITHRKAGSNNISARFTSEALKLINGTGLQLDDDNTKLQIGAGQDLAIYHTGSGSRIENLTGTFSISNAANEIQINKNNSEYMARFITDGAVELYYDNSKKLETISGGVLVQGGYFFDTDNYITCNNTANTMEFVIGNANVAEFNSTALHFMDSKQARFGTGNDLRLYHDGTDSHIVNYTGIQYLQAAGQLVAQNTSGEKYFKAFPNGSVELYYDNSKKLETTSNGVKINESGSGNGEIRINGSTGATEGIVFERGGTEASRISHSNSADLVFSMGSNVSTKLILRSDGHVEIPNDNAKLLIGASEDLQIFHTGGSHSQIADTTGHQLYITADNALYLQSYTGSENYIKCVQNGAVELYYDNAKKLETASYGCEISGTSGYVKSFFKNSNNDYAGAVQGWANGSIEEIGFSNSNGTQWFVRYDRNTSTGARDEYHYQDIQPASNNTYDLGSTSKRWANIYTNDLHLSNEGGANDIDGTYGSFTIQEGAEDLFLINRRNGKKYKFNLTEVA